MAAKKPAPARKYFTPEEANAALPLVRAIVRDITNLAHDLRDRHERLQRLRPSTPPGQNDLHAEELEQARTEIERGTEKMEELERELQQLGVELKDYFTGLIDFRCRKDGREIYLCWRQGEPEVAHWHELDAGFTGRQRLRANAGVV